MSRIQYCQSVIHCNAVIRPELYFLYDKKQQNWVVNVFAELCFSYNEYAFKYYTSFENDLRLNSFSSDVTLSNMYHYWSSQTLLSKSPLFLLAAWKEPIVHHRMYGYHRGYNVS